MLARSAAKSFATQSERSGHRGIFARFGYVANDLACVKTHTSGKCRKYNSPICHPAMRPQRYPFIGERILGFRWNWVLEMGGISLVLIASEWRRKRKSEAAASM
ncbi:MAG TPA: hypothetical protein VIJ17_05790, partial [Pseudolabrys sp.]